MDISVEIMEESGDGEITRHTHTRYLERHQ